MIQRLYLLLLLLLLPGCLATAGDLQTIADQAAASEARVLEAVDQVASGDPAAPDLVPVVERAFADTAKAIGEVRERIEARGDAALDPLTQGGPLTSVLVTALGMAALNWRRNQTRATDPRVANAAKPGGGLTAAPPTG